MKLCQSCFDIVEFVKVISFVAGVAFSITSRDRVSHVGAREVDITVDSIGAGGDMSDIWQYGVGSRVATVVFCCTY